MPAGSALQGHLHRGDALLSVNECQVASCRHWISCVMRDSSGARMSQAALDAESWTPQQILHKSMQAVEHSGMHLCKSISLADSVVGQDMSALCTVLGVHRVLLPCDGSISLLSCSATHVSCLPGSLLQYGTLSAAPFCVR